MPALPRSLQKQETTKLRRYDAFLTSWWRHTHLAGRDAPPFVLFICQDEPQRAQFLAAADRELTGHRWHPSVDPTRYQYVGRERILFCAEPDARAAVLEAWRLPAFPPGHQARTGGLRRVRIAPTTPLHTPTTARHPTARSEQQRAA
jgi:hypothetical protein